MNTLIFAGKMLALWLLGSLAVGLNIALSDWQERNKNLREKG